MTKTISIFGSTGSVGQATLDVIRAHPDKFEVHTLTAHSSVSRLVEQAKSVNARRVVLADETQYAALKSAFVGMGIEIAAGQAALVDAAREEVDLLMAAIVGMAGLEPLVAAMGQARTIAIANKEPLVAAGALVTNLAKQSGTKLLPVDSEHNAIFQVFEEQNRTAIRRLILTASGGPFRDWSLEQMAAATPEQAIAHPNWSMGAKISVDSATMMNKALEVIEAHHLFSVPARQIDVLVHPQSIVHSMVEYIDGSFLAQMGPPDMRVPIAYALGWPERIAAPVTPLDFNALKNLTFSSPDACRFPAIKFSYDCLASGSWACVALNAANEIAVSAFLEGRLGFTEIFETVRAITEDTAPQDLSDISDIITLDQNVRFKTNQRIVNTQPSKRKAS